jgi:hypothetical protein
MAAFRGTAIGPVALLVMVMATEIALAEPQGTVTATVPAEP